MFLTGFRVALVWPSPTFSPYWSPNTPATLCSHLGAFILVVHSACLFPLRPFLMLVEFFLPVSPQPHATFLLKSFLFSGFGSSLTRPRQMKARPVSFFISISFATMPCMWFSMFLDWMHWQISKTTVGFLLGVVVLYFLVYPLLIPFPDS